jgi:5'-3' exonuclease
VNLLPFIDSSRLFAAVREACPPGCLTADEAARNTYGNVLQYTYSESAMGSVIRYAYGICMTILHLTLHMLQVYVAVCATVAVH